MTTQSNFDQQDIVDFVEDICGDDHLRIEHDFGGGFVKLRSSEAEKRQAAQDIRSSEDVILELLRNSRDANAKHIFVATQMDDSLRHILILDDGDGIPATMHDRIFEPRVTSKLDSAHMDRWGMHGRGMALYSISVNSKSSSVVMSEEGFGSSISIDIDTERLAEKSDQSTFPKFVSVSGVLSMRGPRNLLRTVAEFALEHRDDVTVFFGSFTEIAATLYQYGISTSTPSERSYRSNALNVKLVQRPVFGVDVFDVCDLFNELGLNISERSVRRIMNGEILSLSSILERIKLESFPEQTDIKHANSRHANVAKRPSKLKLSEDDKKLLIDGIKETYLDIAEKYFLEGDVPVNLRIGKDAISIDIPIKKGT